MHPPEEPLLFYTAPTLSPFAQRCEELGIETQAGEVIKAKGVSVKTPHSAQRGEVFAFSEESVRDAVMKLCSGLGLVFEKNPSVP